MKQAYISTHLADAQSAGDRFHLNPIILLAQAALESGWGTSRLARETLVQLCREIEPIYSSLKNNN